MLIRKFLLAILIGLIGINFAQAQDKILSNKKLKKQETFTSIEEALGNPDKVYKLKLGGEGSVLKKIPKEVFQLINLQELDLSSNRISKIPDDLFTLTNLQKLDLSLNPVSEIPSGIKQLTNLKTLIAKGCRLNTLPTEIGQLTNLEEIDLFGNHINSLPESMAKLTSIKKINLIKTGISAEELEKAKTMLPNVEFAGF